MGQQKEYAQFLKPAFFFSRQPLNFVMKNKKLKDNCSDQY